jgi:hypothetical protein
MVVNNARFGLNNDEFNSSASIEYTELVLMNE